MSEWNRLEKLDPGRKLMNDVFFCSHPPQGFGVFWIDMENAHSFLDEMRRSLGTHLTYLHLFIRACGLALVKFPLVHAMLDRDSRLLHSSGVDIGVSVEGTTNYAPVVVLKDVEKKDLGTLARELREGAAKAKSEEEDFLRNLRRIGRFLPFRWLRRLLLRFAFQFAKVRRSSVGTFQISSLPEEIIVPFVLNTAALLGIGHIRERPAVVDGNVVPRKSVYISVVIDHRVLDGKVPMLFAYEVIRLMENPRLLVGESSAE